MSKREQAKKMLNELLNAYGAQRNSRGTWYLWRLREKYAEVAKVLENGAVYVCSNPECTMIYDFDPNGHCPICIKENGSGWSTRMQQVFTAEETMRELRAKSVKSA